MRELHHFETEQALARALAVLESHQPGEADHLERIYQAENILRAALGEHPDLAPGVEVLQVRMDGDVRYWRKGASDVWHRSPDWTPKPE